MESVNCLSEMGVGLGLLVGSLLGVRGASGKDGHDLEEQRVDDASYLVDSSGDTEFGLFLEGNQGWCRIGDRIHELEEALDELVMGGVR